MSSPPETPSRASRFPDVKAIYCVLPDNGTDKRILTELRERFGIVRAGSAVRRGVSILAEAKTKRGKLPEAELVKQLTIICPEKEADEIFAFVFWSAHLDKPGQGLMWQQAVAAGTPYQLPEGVPDEEIG